MQKNSAKEIEWRQVSQHRAESPWFRRLLQGVPGEPDNYEFSLVRVDGEYHTPRHKHNFDQIRIMIDGSFDFGNAVQREGMIGYFPAGTPYTQSADSSSVTLLLQIGAACRQGYLSYDQVEEAAEKLAEKGRFDGGLYYWANDQGEEKKRDGYEAVFIEAAGVLPEYPLPRFLNPVIINPIAVEALVDKQLHGRTRALGTFNEYGLSICVREASKGESFSLEGANGQKVLVYCLSGSGETAALGAYEEGVAIALDYSETLALTAGSDSRFVQIDLPDFGRGK